MVNLEVGTVLLVCITAIELDYMDMHLRDGSVSFMETVVH
jgi:hypothetical protein